MLPDLPDIGATHFRNESSQNKSPSPQLSTEVVRERESKTYKNSENNIQQEKYLLGLTPMLQHFFHQQEVFGFLSAEYLWRTGSSSWQEPTFAPKTMKPFSNFPKDQYTTYVALIMIFFHSYVLDKNLECTCKKEDDAINCALYLALPFFILFVFQLWTDKMFMGTWKYTCLKCTCRKKTGHDCFHECECCKRCSKYSFILAQRIMKAIFIGLLWVFVVLIDGDWFVCCFNEDEQHPRLACKDKDITVDERVIVAKLKSKSMNIGLGILSAGFTLVAFILSFRWQKCCENTPSTCCSEKLLYDQMVFQEEGAELEKLIKEEAKKNLEEGIKQKIQKKEWEECFNVAEELVKTTTSSGLKMEKMEMKDLEKSGKDKNSCQSEEEEPDGMKELAQDFGE